MDLLLVLYGIACNRIGQTDCIGFSGKILISHPHDGVLLMKDDRDIVLLSCTCNWDRDIPAESDDRIRLYLFEPTSRFTGAHGYS